MEKAVSVRKSPRQAQGGREWEVELTIVRKTRSMALLIESSGLARKSPQVWSGFVGGWNWVQKRDPRRAWQASSFSDLTSTFLHSKFSVHRKTPT